MADASTVSVLIRARDMASGAFKNVENNAGRMAQGISKHRRTIGLSMTAMGGAITGFGILSVKAAMTLEESMNAVNVVFADGAKTIHAFGEDSAQAVGMSTAAFNQMATVTGALLQDVGLPMTQVAGMTNDLAVRAADMASVFDTDVKDAMSAINQALRGETEAIRRYAGDVTQATLETFALSQGINKSVTEMTEQEKRLLRVALIMEQTNGMAGDFANTSGSLANRMRIARAEFANTSAELGNILLPMVIDAVAKIQEIITAVRIWTDENPKLTSVIVKVTAVIGGLMLVLGPLLLMLPGLVAAFGILAAVGLGPILIAIGAVTLAITAGILIWKNWEKIINFMKGVIASFTKMVIGFIIKLGEGFLAITSWIPGLDDMRDAINRTMDNLHDAQDSVEQWGDASKRVLIEQDAEWAGLEEQQHYTSDRIQEKIKEMGNKTEDLTTTTERELAAQATAYEGLIPTLKSVLTEVKTFEEQQTYFAQLNADAEKEILAQRQIEFKQWIEDGKKDREDRVEHNRRMEERMAEDAERARERQRSSWDTFKQSLDPTMQAIEEAGLDFRGVLERMSEATDVRLETMALALENHGIEWNDTWGLINSNLFKNIDEMNLGIKKLEVEADRVQEKFQNQFSIQGIGQNPEQADAAKKQSAENIAQNRAREISMLAGEQYVLANTPWGHAKMTGDWQSRKAEIEDRVSMMQNNINRMTKDIQALGFSGAFANGGIVGRGGLALVGERGPELVSLPGGSMVHPNGTGPGGTNNFHFHGAVYGVEDLKETVVQAVRDHAISGGFTGVFGGT